MGSNSTDDLHSRAAAFLETEVDAGPEEAKEVLQSVVDCAEDGCFGELFEECAPDCACVICDVRRALLKPEGASHE